MTRELPTIELRPATKEDSHKIWKWRNEPETREASFNTESISWETHQTWFKARVESSRSTWIFIVVDESGEDVGYVRFDQVGGADAEISVSIDPGRRRAGLGIATIRAGCNYSLEKGLAKRVIAHIKKDNFASVRAFERAGFKMSGEMTIRNTAAYEMVFEAGD